MEPQVKPAENLMVFCVAGLIVLGASMEPQVKPAENLLARRFV